MSDSVSVIITTYNSARDMLVNTVDSVLKQTHPVDEIIIVDDCSRVPFAGIDKIYSDVSNITWVPLHHNVGVGAARNIGFRKSTGKYISYLDHDDWWEPQKIKRQLDLMEDRNTCWVYCGMVRHKQNNTLIEERPKHSGNIYAELLKEQVITGSISSVMINRDTLEKCGGFDEGRNVIEDWDLWIRLAEKNPVGYVDELLVHLSMPDVKSRSANIEARLLRLKGLMDKHRKGLEKYKLMRYATARYYRVRARLYHKVGDFPKSAGAWLYLVFRYPSKTAIAGLATALFETLPKWIIDK